MRRGGTFILELSRYDALVRMAGSLEVPMTLEITILTILVVLVLGLLPSWPYSRELGYGPSGLIGVVLVILLVMALTGRVPA
jgi:Protein of unknown function (DUF3309)